MGRDFSKTLGTGLLREELGLELRSPDFQSLELSVPPAPGGAPRVCQLAFKQPPCLPGVGNQWKLDPFVSLPSPPPSSCRARWL